MVGIVSNAGQIAKRYQRRRQRLDRALGRGLKKAAAAIDREQVDNLSGSGSAAPGDYPVPIRTGTLRGGHFFRVRSERLAIVGNTTEYAVAIHEDRPFLDDAAEAVDHLAIVAGEVRKAVLAE